MFEKLSGVKEKDTNDICVSNKIFFYSCSFITVNGCGVSPKMSHKNVRRHLQASPADVLRGSSCVCPCTHRGAGTRDEPVRTSVRGGS